MNCKFPVKCIKSSRVEQKFLNSIQPGIILSESAIKVYYQSQRLFISLKKKKIRLQLYSQHLRMKKEVSCHVLSHVFTVQNGVAAVALEAPDVPLSVQGDEGLSFAQLLPAAGARARILASSASADSRVAAAHWGRRLAHRYAHAPVAQRLTWILQKVNDQRQQVTLSRAD